MELRIAFGGINSNSNFLPRDIVYRTRISWEEKIVAGKNFGGGGYHDTFRAKMCGSKNLNDLTFEYQKNLAKYLKVGKASSVIVVKSSARSCVVPPAR